MKRQDLDKRRQICSEAELFTSDGQSEVGAEGGPQLQAHRVGDGAVKSVDAQTVFEPAKEQLDLPAVTIQLGDDGGPDTPSRPVLGGTLRYRAGFHERSSARNSSENDPTARGRRALAEHPARGVSALKLPMRNARHHLAEDGLAGVHPASDPKNALPRSNREQLSTDTKPSSHVPCTSVSLAMWDSIELQPHPRHHESAKHEK